MRLCRFEVDGLTLSGFYHEDGVFGVEAVAEAFEEATGDDLGLPEPEGLIDDLMPGTARNAALRRLSGWLAGLDGDEREALRIDPKAEGVKLLCPLERPRSLFFLAGNYAAHVVERGGVAAERAETFPYVFMKPTTTLTHPGDPIVLPAVTPDHIDWEAELGVVIGTRCHRVREAEALAYVAGYTVVNDVSDRKFTPNPGRKPRERDKFFDWLHGKWHDTFCPVGPCLLSAAAVADPQDLPVRLTVNGQVRQDGTTAQMVFPVAAVVSFLSQFVTLEPGDLISTGTPSGVGSATGTYLRPGDVVAATVGGVGRLENPVVAG
ncbi:MAG TPA: fumarylacetoacetate hydrolase family protein [Isosphaeraceae bacterium]|jgi:2-keto-4-pentenoate hydratase/2-oxohepta-3-ene-1,7-dioic acid hydratase in catechol pathway|nr:fumarylacetoacetate hydrolase family protein [Isosphaeraceae bacterium]